MAPRDGTSDIEILLLMKMPPKRQNTGNRTNAAKRKQEERQNETEEETAQRNEGNMKNKGTDRNEQGGNSRLRMQMNRLVKPDRIAFQYNSEIEYSLHPVVVVESVNKVCTNCKALKFKNEAPGMCCLHGKVKLPPLKAPLEPLFSLVAGTTTQSKYFLNNLALNSAIAMEPIRAHMVHVKRDVALSFWNPWRTIQKEKRWDTRA
ncbi:hypothetical protein AVEN_189856-1 [Araneus ventricosus]|uniref:Helitron helicase-like domain-containing protein n=1 Tax=Araneus ventricosus TaxID=182803 RepID=A0A4Y2EG66_ARAVE|nr:hypothetical protein AVEN_189856-1 [Araneus ventricosus]